MSAGIVKLLSIVMTRVLMNVAFPMKLTLIAVVHATSSLVFHGPRALQESFEHIERPHSFSDC